MKMKNKNEISDRFYFLFHFYFGNIIHRFSIKSQINGIPFTTKVNFFFN